jgi:hypothetical protein
MEGTHQSKLGNKLSKKWKRIMTTVHRLFKDETPETPGKKKRPERNFKSFTCMLMGSFFVIAFCFLFLFVFHKIKQEVDLSEYLSSNYEIAVKKYNKIAVSVAEMVRSQVYFYESFILRYMNFVNLDPAVFKYRNNLNSRSSRASNSSGIFPPNLVLSNGTAKNLSEITTCSSDTPTECYTKLNGTYSDFPEIATVNGTNTSDIIVPNFYLILDKNREQVSSKNDYFSKFNMTENIKFNFRAATFMKKYSDKIDPRFKTFIYSGVIDSFFLSEAEPSPNSYLLFLAPALTQENPFVNITAFVGLNSTVYVYNNTLSVFVLSMDRYSRLNREAGFRTGHEKPDQPVHIQGFELHLSAEQYQ